MSAKDEKPKTEWDVIMEISGHPPISERRIAEYLNAGWEPIGMVTINGLHYAYFRRPVKP